jgi:succinyl-diaminopimelate desuccinylase
MSVENVLHKTENIEKEVAHLCSELVKFNSAHPDGFTDECVNYIKDYFEKNGIENTVYAKEEKKPNIVANIRGKTTKKIIWVGHLDVVPEGKPENWTHPPYDGVIDNGFVYGRGSSDMKGACAAAMVSARILNELESIPNNVEYWFTADEEIGGGAGARWLAETGKFSGDACVIGDGNGGGWKNPSIDIGCKGGAGTKLIARGKTAHGSTPYLGDNAITKLMKGIPWVEKIGEFELNIPTELHEPIKSSIEFLKASQEHTPEQEKAVEWIYYHPSVSCNIISGGVKTNVVPDYAEAQFDIRLTPGSNPLRVRDRILELVQESKITGLEAEVRARETAGYYESPNSSFASQLSKTIEKITGKKPSFKILTGGTDGISTSRIAGIPSLGWGTSLAGEAHQPNEKISIENLVLGVKIYSAFPLLFNE